MGFSFKKTKKEKHFLSYSYSSKLKCVRVIIIFPLKEFYFFLQWQSLFGYLFFPKNLNFKGDLSGRLFKLQIFKLSFCEVNDMWHVGRISFGLSKRHVNGRRCCFLEGTWHKNKMLIAHCLQIPIVESQNSKTNWDFH